MAATEAVLRLMVQDPAGASQYLATADYTAIIALESNEYRAAALAARTIAAQLATKVSIEVGTIRISLQQKYYHYMKLADEYDFRAGEGGGSDSEIAAPSAGGISLSDMESTDGNTDRPPNKFKVGQFDNPPTTYNSDSDSELEL